MWKIASCLIVLFSVVTLPSCNRPEEDPSVSNENSQPDSSDKPFVIGQQLADAHEAEKKRQESAAGGSSPLPDTGYDFWRGDFNLIEPTSNPLDDKIRVVCSQYAKSDTDQRTEIRRSISLDQFYTLINFAKRSAVFGVRQAKPDLVSDGLTAIAMIEKKRVDFRDVLSCLALQYHAANRAGGDADKMFRDAAELAGPGVAELFENFTQRAPDGRSLRKSWGYDEVQTDNGIGFIGWGFRDYNPTLDLASTIIDISKLVASDQYQPGQIELATELPAVWLGGQDNPATQRILSSVGAAASLSAKLHPDKHADHASQQFSVFLVEAANESDSQALYQLVQENKTSHHFKIAVARSRLFCLVVARSFVQGVDAYETEESLTRFSDGIAAILERHSEIENTK